MTHPSRDIQACIEVLNRRSVEYGEKARKHEKTHGINTYRHGELNLYRKAYEDAAFAISKLKPTSPWLPIDEAPKDDNKVDVLLKITHHKTGIVSFVRETDCLYCDESKHWWNNGCSQGVEEEYTFYGYPPDITALQTAEVVAYMLDPTPDTYPWS